MQHYNGSGEINGLEVRVLPLSTTECVGLRPLVLPTILQGGNMHWAHILPIRFRSKTRIAGIIFRASVN